MPPGLDPSAAEQDHEHQRMTTTFTGIQNENEFYSHHYLAELFANDIQATTARWREAAAEGAGGTNGANGERTPDQALRALALPSHDKSG